MPNEFYRVAFCKKVYRSIDEMQAFRMTRLFPGLLGIAIDDCVVVAA